MAIGSTAYQHRAESLLAVLAWMGRVFPGAANFMLLDLEGQS